MLAISFASMYPDWLYPGDDNSQPAKLPNDSEGIIYRIRAGNPTSWRAAVQLTDDFGAQAVVIPWWTVFWGPMSLYLTRSLRRRGIPVIFLCHNIVDHEAREWKRWLTGRVLGAGQAFVTHTEHNRANLLKLVPDANIAVYPHPDYDDFPEPGDIPERRAALELLFFGYVRHYKGLDLLISALGLLNDGELDFHLRIAGEVWGDEAVLRDQIAKLGLEHRVTLIPKYVDDQHAADFMTACDAVVLPYRKASGSGVAALALHYDTPVLASRVGGLAETVIDGETGRLVPPNDIGALADAIRSLTQPKDWSRLIATHKGKATWDGLSAAVIKQIDQTSAD